MISSMILFLLLASSCFAGGSSCEFNMTCDNVGSMLIEKSLAAWNKQGDPTEVREIYVCGVFLKGDNETKLEDTVRNCNDSHYVVRAGSHMIDRPSTGAIPGGGCFTFFEETLEELMVKVNQICPDIDITYGPVIAKEFSASGMN